MDLDNSVIMLNPFKVLTSSPTSVPKHLSESDFIINGTLGSRYTFQQIVVTSGSLILANCSTTLGLIV